jgi:putative hemin transport protein
MAALPGSFGNTWANRPENEERLMSATMTMPLDRIRAALAASPSQMTLQLARQLGVPEVDVIRAMPDGRSVELDLARPEELLTALADLGKVHVIVSNGCVTSETVGEFGGFSKWGEFFNIQSKTLDMHVRHAQLGAAFAVEKPSHVDGVNTHSIQFFDRDGASAFKVFVTFGGQKAPPERIAAFHAFRDRFRKA